jgi:hypothetical protein
MHSIAMQACFHPRWQLSSNPEFWQITSKGQETRIWQSGIPVK